MDYQIYEIRETPHIFSYNSIRVWIKKEFCNDKVTKFMNEKSVWNGSDSNSKTDKSWELLKPEEMEKFKQELNENIIIGQMEQTKELLKTLKIPESIFYGKVH